MTLFEKLLFYPYPVRVLAAYKVRSWLRGFHLASASGIRDYSRQRKHAQARGSSTRRSTAAVSRLPNGGMSLRERLGRQARIGYCSMGMMLPACRRQVSRALDPSWQHGTR